MNSRTLVATPDPDRPAVGPCAVCQRPIIRYGRGAHTLCWRCDETRAERITAVRTARAHATRGEAA